MGPRAFLPAWDTPAIEPDENKRLLWLELECLPDTTQDVVASTRSVTFQTIANAQPYRVIDRFWCSEDTAKGRIFAQCDTMGNKVCDIYHFPAWNTLTTAQNPLNQLPGLGQVFKIPQIAPDGIPGEFPYVAFRDPTFNRMLYIDLFSLAQAGSPSFDVAPIDPGPGFELADQVTLNAAIAILSTRVGEILNLIGGF